MRSIPSGAYSNFNDLAETDAGHSRRFEANRCGTKCTDSCKIRAKNHEADMSESLIDEFERRLAKCRDEAASGLGTEMSEWYSWLIDNGPKIVEMARSRSLRTEN